MRLRCTLLLLFFSFNANALTCTGSELNVLYVNGATETLLGLDYSKDILNEFLESNAHLIDVNGIKDVGIAKSYLINDYKSLLIPFFRKLKQFKPDRRFKAARDAKKILAGESEDLVGVYTLTELEELNEEIGKFLIGIDVGNFERSSASVFFPFKTIVDSGERVVLMSSGYGGWSASSAILRTAAVLGAEDAKLKNIGFFMISPPRRNINRTDLTSFNYISLFQDAFQRAQLNISGVNRKLYPNLFLNGTLQNLFIGANLDTYTSTDRTAGLINNSAPSITLEKHFLRLISSVVSKLKNTNSSCCGGRPGEIWINKGSCVGAECIGGFIEEGIIYDRANNNLTVVRDSQVCKNPIYNNGTPRISGNVDIKGNLILGDSAAIEGGSSFSSPVYIDSLDKTIELRGSTKIISEMGVPLKLKGSVLSVGNTVLRGKLDILGVDYSAFSISNYRTAFNSAKISGETTIRGPVLISGKITGSEITGVSDSQNILHIDSQADIESAKISGIGTIAAAVKDKAVIEGERIGTRVNGVVVYDDSARKSLITGQGTKVKGNVYVSGSTVSGGSSLWGNYQASVLTSIYVFDTNVQTSKVIGLGNLGGGLNLVRSDVEGCNFFIQYTDIFDSKLYGVGFLNTPLNNQVIGVKENAYDSCPAPSLTRSDKYKPIIVGSEYNRSALLSLFGY